MSNVPPQDPGYGQDPGYQAPPPAGYQPPPGGYQPPPAPGYTPGPAANAWQGPPLAEWPQRVLAYLIDWVLGAVAFVVVIIIAAILGAVSSALGGIFFFLGYLLLLAYGFALGYWNGGVGQTIGKKTIGIKVVRQDNGQLLGGGMGIVRMICHFLDGICFIGYLFPLWDPMKQTFADKIMKTVVIQVPKQPFKLEIPS